MVAALSVGLAECNDVRCFHMHVISWSNSLRSCTCIISGWFLMVFAREHIYNTENIQFKFLAIENCRRCNGLAFHSFSQSPNWNIVLSIRLHSANQRIHQTLPFACAATNCSGESVCSKLAPLLCSTQELYICLVKKSEQNVRYVRYIRCANVCTLYQPSCAMGGVVSKLTVRLHYKLWKSPTAASLSVFASLCLDFGWLFKHQLVVFKSSSNMPLAFRICAEFMLLSYYREL